VFRPFRFKKSFVRKRQNLVTLSNALLLYCTLYTDSRMAATMLRRVTWAMLRLLVYSWWPDSLRLKLFVLILFYHLLTKHFSRVYLFISHQ